MFKEATRLSEHPSGRTGWKGFAHRMSITKVYALPQVNKYPKQNQHIKGMENIKTYKLSPIQKSHGGNPC